MGTAERREREKQQRRELIQKCALEVFASYGYDHATMDEIASRAELSKGAIYLYFHDKDELFSSLIEQGITEFQDVIRSSLESIDDPEERIRKVVGTILEYFRARKDIIRLFMYTLGRLSKKAHGDLHKIMLSARDRAVELLEWALEPAYKSGVIRNDITLEMAAVFFQSTVVGALSWFLTHDFDEIDNERTREILFELFSRGVFNNEK
ncbi:hypothetical protein DRQ36_04825 [bacterium]|nr:MAG: hypothetical protein DRQ36_04825 [bacterium]